MINKVTDTIPWEKYTYKFDHDGALGCIFADSCFQLFNSFEKEVMHVIIDPYKKIIYSKKYPENKFPVEKDGKLKFQSMQLPDKTRVKLDEYEKEYFNNKGIKDK